MEKIKITLSNREKSKFYELNYQLKNHPLARKWFKSLWSYLECPGKTEVRYTGFSGKYRDKKTLIDKLNRCIEVINKDGVHQGKKIENYEWNTQTHNEVHHLFEICIGTREQYTEYAINASAEVKNAIKGLNDLTHELEEALRDTPLGAIHTTFLDETGKVIPGTPIEKEEYKYFDLNFSWGDMLLHYCQLGKTWLEVFLDEDEEIFESNINPLAYVDGSFDIFFLKPISCYVQRDFFKWLEENGKNPYDPELRLGYVSAATLIEDDKMENMSIKEKIDFLSQYINLHKVHLTDRDYNTNWYEIPFYEDNY